MISFPPALQKLIKDLSKLPSIGEKSATRLAYHLINNDRPLIGKLVDSLQEASKNIRLCQKCFFISEDEFCSVCKDESRDQQLMCVIEKPMDLIAIERMGEFSGVYHVLHGLWAPLRGQGPEQMKFKELMARVKEQNVKEVILATSATVEGDATAIFIAKALHDVGVSSTRLAQGMSKGAELEYADDLTLSRAFAGRNRMSVT